MSIVLVLVIVLALVLAAAIGVELYARNRGETKVAGAIECLVEDKADVSFGFMPPFLMQHMTEKYTSIHIETAGNQLRDAQGHESRRDRRGRAICEDTADSGGTIGSLVAKIDWTAAGMSQSIQDAIPLIGSLISGVTTNPSDGTVELEAALGSIVDQAAGHERRPHAAGEELTGLGFTLPREAIQPALDALTSKLTDELPDGHQGRLGGGHRQRCARPSSRPRTRRSRKSAGRLLLLESSDGQPVVGSFHRKLLTYLPMSMASWRLTPDGWPGP